MRLSKKGLAFIAGHEGFVPHAYRDPVGILTIGYGFTMRSAVFAAWWRAAHGRELRQDDVITRADSEQLLERLVDEEYGRAVLQTFGRLPQHQFDACCSVAYNLGPRALTWRWARALKAGDLARAAAILRDNYNTAAGRRLAGLVRRRKEEARLLEAGIYPAHTHAWRKNRVIRDDRMLLAERGYRGADVRAVVRRFQRDHPPLRVDGLFGPASRAAALAAVRRRKMQRDMSGAGALALVGVMGWWAQLPLWAWAVPVAATVMVCGFLLIARYRPCR